MSAPTPPVAPPLSTLIVNKNTALAKLSATTPQTNAQLFAKELALTGHNKSDSNGQQINTAATNNSRLAVYAPNNAGALGTASTANTGASKPGSNTSPRRRRHSSVSKKR